VGSLVRGDLLISNFNDEENLQGTGTTIVQVSPGGVQSLFTQINPATLHGCPGGVGLTTALSVLPDGYVVVGSLPSANGEAAMAQPGCLIVLDSSGHVVKTISGGAINGPWDMTSVSDSQFTALFVTNVLNGTVAAKGGTVYRGTVLRLILQIPRHGLPWIQFDNTIGSGFGEQLNAAALVIGPTGVGLGRNGVLYVADTLANRVAGIPDAVFRGFSAGRGFTVSAGHHINGDLGLVVAPGGDILTVNSNNGNLVEITPFGAQVAVRTLDSSGSPAGAGALFGLAVKPGHRAVYFVDDATNTLNLLH
jgi:hypothetical protein